MTIHPKYLPTKIPVTFTLAVLLALEVWQASVAAWYVIATLLAVYNLCCTFACFTQTWATPKFEDKK